jgi:hypothetical protein
MPNLYLQLESALEASAFEAFRRVALAHSSEGLYCMALFTSNGYEYVYDTANSEKGLAHLVALDIEGNGKADRSAAIDAYKWSPCDWPYHLENEGLFQRPCELLQEIWAGVREASEEESDRAYVEIHEVFIAVLRKLRSSGIVPEGCLVTLLAGDQSDEARVANAEKINPPELVARFIADFRLDAARLSRLRNSRWQSGEFFEP